MQKPLETPSSAFILINKDISISDDQRKYVLEHKNHILNNYINIVI